MSTNSNCDIIEVRTGAWFYVLEDYNAPKNAWDWYDYATAYGPFPSEEAALTHLDRNHANPGGFCRSPLPEGQTERDLSKEPTLQRLIQDAEASQSSASHTGFFKL